MKPNEGMVRNFLRASTALGLRRLMLLNNRRLGYFVQYDIILETKKGEWIAWYYTSIEHEMSKKPIGDKGSEE